MLLLLYGTAGPPKFAPHSGNVAPEGFHPGLCWGTGASVFFRKEWILAFAFLVSRGRWLHGGFEQVEGFWNVQGEKKPVGLKF